MRNLQHFNHLMIKTTDGPRLIDVARGRPLNARPEEYVRQDVLRSLMECYGYPVESLLAEEPVARGSGNRRRADVLVELPAQLVDAHSIEAFPGQATTQDIRWQSKVIAERLGNAVEIISCPDEMRLELDGKPVDCRTLGYQDVRGGIALVLQCDRYKELGLPPIFNLLVLGLNLREIEHRVARSLGLPVIKFHSGHNRTFAEAALGPLSQLGLCHDFNKVVHYDEGIGGGLSPDGRCGWVVLRAEPHAPQGVLARVDLDSRAWRMIEATPEDTGPDQSAMRVQDNVWRRAALLDVPTRTLLVVECKRPDVAYSEEVFNQGLDYARTRGARYIVVTSGPAGFTHAYQIVGEKRIEIEDIPTYNQAISDDTFCVRRVPAPLAHTALPLGTVGRTDLVVCHARTRDAVGADLAHKYWTAVLRVDDALRDTSFKLGDYLAQTGLELINDFGMRWHETDHVAGRIPARYRDWLVRDASGQDVLVCLTMRALRAVRQHDKWNKDGRTMRATSSLMGATPCGAKIRNELEYNMGKATIDPAGIIHFTHKGKMAKGGGGGVKGIEVRTFVNRQAPVLVHDDAVALGALPSRRKPTADELGNFLARFVAYVKLRRDFKLGTR